MDNDCVSWESVAAIIDRGRAFCDDDMVFDSDEVSDAMLFLREEDEGDRDMDSDSDSDSIERRFFIDSGVVRLAEEMEGAGEGYFSSPLPLPAGAGASTILNSPSSSSAK